MFAVLRDRGRQYRVSPGQQIWFDFKEGLHAGQKIEFKDVLVVSSDGGTVVGRPAVDGAKVIAEVVDPFVRDERVEVFHWRRRRGYRKLSGHHQPYSVLKIVDVQHASIKKAAEAPKPAKPEEPKKKEPTKKHEAPKAEKPAKKVTKRVTKRKSK